jgi:uncharacterized membrane protein
VNRAPGTTLIILSFLISSIGTAAAQSWQKGFDFRATAGYVTDPAGATYVLASTSYPTTANGVTFGWTNTALVQARDRSTSIDPRLAGINYATNGSPATFYVDLPSAGTYNVSLAMGDGGYPQCWTQCQMKFLDGSTVLATVSAGYTAPGYFYDATAHNWSAATWPSSNLSLPLTLTGSRLTIVVGSNNNTGDITPIAFLGVQQTVTTPNFAIAANPTSLNIAQGSQGTSTISTTISGGFNSSISLSAIGLPTGTTASFNPATIPAPGNGSSTMTFTVGASTPVGTYPVTVTGNGGGLQQNVVVTLTVTAAVQPDFTLSASPSTLTVAQGSIGNSTLTTTIQGGFNSAISFSSTGAPAGTTVSFNPGSIPAPGNGTSAVTITVGPGTALGTYPITLTGNGGGKQHSATLTLTVTSSVWQKGFDFRATAGFVTDPGGATYVLASTSYPTTTNGVTFGWTNTALVQSRDRSTSIDPRLAGINYAANGSPATFYVDLPSAGTYNVSLAMGDAGYPQCWTQCQVQFLDGGTVLATVTGGPSGLGYFYDATGRNWSAAAWPASNLSLPLTLTGSRLTVVVGSNNNSGDITPIAFLGVQQTVTTPNFAIAANPTSLSIAQGSQGTSTISTTISGGFNSSISLSASGLPTGTTASFNPATIPAPGNGSSTMTFTVGASTPVGTYPITVTGNGGGLQQNVVVTLTVTAAVQPDFTLSASPSTLTVAQGSIGNSTLTTTIQGGFNSAISFSSTGVPAGTTVSFNPSSIPAPGNGTSAVTITVGPGTALGTYPITVTGNGGGKQHSATVTLTVTSSAWQKGFDFRATAGYVTDPAGATYVLASTSYPTTANGVTFGWTNTSLVRSADRGTTIDPRLAGINYATNGSPATFYVDLPSAGTYNVSLAMGDAGYPQCWTQCQVQFFDGGTILATVSGGPSGLGYFYDASGRNWSAAAWPASNIVVPVTLGGPRLTIIVGSNNNSGDITPVAFIGVTQVTSVPSFTLSAAPASLSVAQGTQGTTTVTSSTGAGFNSSITLSASGAPAGITVTFNPGTIPAPGSGNSTVTFAVSSTTTIGTYPVTITGNGGSVHASTTVTLTVIAGSQPDFSISVSPRALTLAQGRQGSPTILTSVIHGFNSSVALSATGVPSGTTVTFHPSTIPAPGGGTSTMTIAVSSAAALGTFPITITGNGGGTQHGVVLNLTVTSLVWQRGFDFRATANYVTDPPNSSPALPADLYPTGGELATYGWQGSVNSSNRSTLIDPRLAGLNYVPNGSPKVFTVDLPAPGTYKVSLAMGDAGYPQCGVLCQVQLLDGNRVLATVSGPAIAGGNFYDMMGNVWSAAAWPNSNVPVQVTLTGTQLSAQVATNNNTGDYTPIAYLGLQLVTPGPTFALEGPGSVNVGQGENVTSDVSSVLIGAFNSSVTLSATGAPAGSTITFSPSVIPAPGSGTAVMTISVASGTPVGNYPVTLKGTAGSIVQTAPAVLTVTPSGSADFAITGPSGVGVAPGGHSNATATTMIIDSFSASIALTSSGGPSGTIVSFSPSTIPAPGVGTSAITITVPAGTARGSYPLTITGTGGGKSHHFTTNLTVSTGGNVNLPAGTGWIPLNSDLTFCNVSPGSSYFNPQVGGVDALDFLSLCELGTMVAYSGGAVDPYNDRYFLWTSGHNNYQGNEVYELDLFGTSPSISRITDPAWTVVNTDVPGDCACRGTNNCGQGMWHDGGGNPVASPFLESGFGGPKFESIPAPDGSQGQPSCGYGTQFQPNSRETYSGLAYDPTRQHVYSWGGVPAADPTSTGMLSNWSLDLTQQPPRWTRLHDFTYIWYTAAVYDFTTGHPTSGYDLIYDEITSLYAYNPTTDTYVTLANSIPFVGSNVNMQLDPLHHAVVLENGDNNGGYHLRIVNLDSCNGTTCSVTNLDSQITCQGTMGYWAGAAWDSKRNVMTIFPSSNNCTGTGCTAPFNTAYLLNTDPSNPVTITYQGTQRTVQPQQCFAATYGSTLGVDYPPMSLGPGVYSRFSYFPNEDVYLFIPHPDQPIWILRLE